MYELIIILVWATCIMVALVFSLFCANEFPKHTNKIKVQIVIVALLVWAVCCLVGYKHNMYWCSRQQERLDNNQILKGGGDE